jgi:hypothetical protein
MAPPNQALPDYKRRDRQAQLVRKNASRSRKPRVNDAHKSMHQELRRHYSRLLRVVQYNFVHKDI